MTYERAAAWVRKWRVVAAVVGLVTWLAWAGHVASGDGLIDDVGDLVAADHLGPYASARLIREGRAGEMYDYRVAKSYQADIVDYKWRFYLAFRNPPFYALLYVPTAGWSFPASAWFWNGVSLVALWLGVRWLGVEKPWVVIGWALAFYPVFTVFSFGQNSLLSFAVFAGTYRLLANGRVFAAGLVAGLLCFKPTLLIGLVVWGLLDIRKLWPAAVGVGVTGAVLVGGSYAIIPEAWAAFVENFRTVAAFNKFSHLVMHNPRSFWLHLSPWDGATGVLVLASSLAGVGVFFRVWRSRRSDTGVMFGAVVALTLWASPHTMIYEWALAVIPAALWWEHDARHRDEWLVVFAVMWAAFLTGTEVSKEIDWVERKLLGWDRVFLVQYTVAVAAWAGWKAAKLLTTGGPR